MVVLEARDRVGGRLLTEQREGRYVEMGGQWLAPYQDQALALAAELGIESFPRPKGGADVYVGLDGRRSTHPHDRLPLDAAGTAELDRIFDALSELTETVDADNPWTHPRAAELDGMTFDAWLRSQSSHEEAVAVAATIVGAFMTKDVVQFSVLAAAWLAATSGGVPHLTDADEVLNRQLVGGLSQIPTRLAEQFGDRVRLGCPVRSVQWSDTGVVAGTEAGDVAARAMILAVPPNLLSGIRFDPALPAWRMTMDEHFSQGLVIKVQAFYPRPFWRDEGLSGTGFTRGCPSTRCMTTRFPTAARGSSSASSPPRPVISSSGWTPRPGGRQCSNASRRTSGGRPGTRWITRRAPGTQTRGLAAPTHQRSAPAGWSGSGRT